FPMCRKALAPGTAPPGRAGAAGEAISLVSSDESGLLRDIERVLRRSIPTLPTPAFKIVESAQPPAREGRPHQGQVRHGGGHGGRPGQGGGGGYGGNAGHHNGARREGHSERRDSRRPGAAGARSNTGSGSGSSSGTRS